MSWPGVITYSNLLDIVAVFVSSFTRLTITWLCFVLLIFDEGLETTHQSACGCIYCKDVVSLAASFRGMV
jgi:hypothetical protein